MRATRTRATPNRAIPTKTADAHGYRLTTAEILYHLPDHPSLLQSFIWQSLDLAPRFPVLHRFLRFWQQEVEGSIHSVRVGSALLFGPHLRHASHLLTLN